MSFQVGKPKVGFNIFVTILIVGALFGLGKLWTSGTFDKWIPREQKTSVAKKDLGEFKSQTGLERPIRVNVVPWYGYAGLYYMNGGLEASTNSRFYKEYGILVDIILSADIPNQIEQWKAGEADVMWSTADAFPIDASGIQSFFPQVIFQADWSRGGDAIVTTRGIEKVSDLRGKKIAVAFGTPSHTFLYWLLNSAGMDWADVEIVKVLDAAKAAEMFKSGAVQCAVVWSPDDQLCVKAVPGSKVFKSTKTATNIIADIFYVKKEWLSANKEIATKLTEAWISANGIINTNPEAALEVSKVMAGVMNVSLEDARAGLSKVRLATHGDNMNFFGLNSEYKGVTGEELYTKMNRVYSSMNLTDNAPSWRDLINTQPLQSTKLGALSSDHAEGVTRFAPVTEKEKTVEAFSSKSLNVNFGSGSFALSDEAKEVVDRFAEIAKTFAHAKIRVVGNTDNTGSYEKNKTLSYKRAQAVASHLIMTYGFDPNRFVIRGDGPDSPKGDNATEEGRSVNRRTDFELIDTY